MGLVYSFEWLIGLVLYFVVKYPDLLRVCKNHQQVLCKQMARLILLHIVYDVPRMTSDIAASVFISGVGTQQEVVTHFERNQKSHQNIFFQL